MPEQTTAVALRYVPAEGAAAPTVVAKGDGFVADEILRLARAHGVPLRSDPALAGALATLDVGRQIPPELFRAVAALLAFVYALNGEA